MNDRIFNYIKHCEEGLKPYFEVISSTALYNQEKVLKAFSNNNVCARHFNFSTGYGYDDIGRDTIARVYADVFKTESAIVSPLLTSGTHTLTVALFGLLRTGDELLSISGKPYDTLNQVISGKGNGSLSDYGISFAQVPLKDGLFDKEAIKAAINPKTRVVFFTRSRGYEWRNALSIESMKDIIAFVKALKSDVIVMVDNCYGEFVEEREPCEVGADVCAGSLIKNIGGGLCVSGGYVVGKKECVERISYRLTAPSIGCEVGSFVGGYLQMFQGLFIAPSVVSNALKGSKLIAECLRGLGYDAIPDKADKQGDIITSVKFNTKQEAIDFCRNIQFNSPVDSCAVLEPWDMPGYEEQVIMAAGTFVQGASIELSCDSPMKEPYIVYIQGGLTYEHVVIALSNCIEKLNFCEGIL